MICKDIKPFATTENKGFRCLMKKLVPPYTVPSTFTITKKFENKYYAVKEDLKKKLVQAL